MPKSRGRQRKQRRSTPRGGRTRVSAEDRARAAVDIPIIGRVDAAEARGDVRAALQLMEEDFRRRPKSEMFWSPERVGNLMQLVVLESVLPAWAYSRWILQQ